MIMRNQITKLVNTTVVTVFLMSAFLQTVYAQNDSSRMVAMQIAESKTGGRSLRAKFVKRKDGKKGYRVRLMKNNSSGKERVVHVFISLKEIR